MPRPKRCRMVCNEPEYTVFSPEGILHGDIVTLNIEEYEVIRLVDLEKLTHNQAAVQMEISKTTVTEIYNSARIKIADSIVNGKRLIVSGGNYRLCEGKKCGKECPKQNFSKMKILFKEGNTIMRIAVTYENGQIFNISVTQKNLRSMMLRTERSSKRKSYLQWAADMALWQDF